MCNASIESFPYSADMPTFDGAMHCLQPMWIHLGELGDLCAMRALRDMREVPDMPTFDGAMRCLQTMRIHLGELGDLCAMRALRDVRFLCYMSGIGQGTTCN